MNDCFSFFLNIVVSNPIRESQNAVEQIGQLARNKRFKPYKGKSKYLNHKDVDNRNTEFQTL